MRVASYDSIMMDKVKHTEALWEHSSRRAFVMPGKRGDYVPKSPKKPCAYPGCPRLTDRRFCPEHEKLDRDRYNKYERSPDRICYTVELDEKFCDVIVKRYIEQVGSSEDVTVQRDGVTFRFDEVANVDE